MITQIKLTNFKCFQGEHTFPLSRFNLLTGINGKGKSTFLQSLLLMKQTIDYNSSSNYIILNGSCVQLGSFEDIKNAFASNEDEVKFVFYVADGKEKREFHYTFEQDENDDSVAVITKFSKLGTKEFLTWLLKKYNDENQTEFYYFRLDEAKEELKNLNWLEGGANIFFYNLIPNNTHTYSYLFKTLQYISADRIGPKNFHERQNVNQDFIGISSRGENVASILFKFKDTPVYEAIYLGKDTNTLLQQTEEWLNFIFDGAKINIKAEGGVVLIAYNTKQGRERYKPSNVGFGYSYILPIVVAGLIAQKEEILIIENPEAHLHPSAQHKLTQFLAKVAATGVQIFVESHSEHILNAIRICTIHQENKEKILNTTDLSILYFQDDAKQSCIQIPLDEKAGIEDWPDGFFDQTDKDFKILFGF